MNMSPRPESALIIRGGLEKKYFGLLVLPQILCWEPHCRSLSGFFRQAATQNIDLEINIEIYVVEIKYF